MFGLCCVLSSSTIILLRKRELVPNHATICLSVFCASPLPCADPEGGQGVPTIHSPTPLKNHKNIGFLSNTDLDPLKKQKATKPAFNVGPSSAHQMVFPWLPFSAIWILFPLVKKKVVCVGPLLAKLWLRVCLLCCVSQSALVCVYGISCPRGYLTFFMLNSN